MDLNGVLLESAPILSQLATEVRGISAYATFIARNDTELEDGLARATAVQAASAGRQAGITMPEFLAADKKDENGEPVKDKKTGAPIKSKTGRSRKEWLVRHNAVTAFRSWQERVKAVNGESSKHVSQGWKRTMDASPPSYGEDFINLGVTDHQYAVIENNPFKDGEIVLKMVVQGKWYRLIFKFDNTRFPEGKVTLPLIKIEDSQPIFIFTVATDNPVVQFSGDYVIGVDVGINNYASVAVINSSTGKIVYSSTLSQRIHSLWNSVRASERQVRALRKKARKILYNRPARRAALEEAQLHREATSRKKRELAILAAQEIAYLSYFWDNAVVAVEDLSWVKNTMQNGRWNRGALVKWLTHYVAQNGGWVVAVNATDTSQVCHLCGSEVTHPEHKVSLCPKCGAMDRDVNAAANIAARAVPKVEKAREKRGNNSKLQEQAPLKTPVARRSLKYPGQDRTKNAPTPKRKKRHTSKGVKTFLSPARVQQISTPVTSALVVTAMTTVLADCLAYGVAGTSAAIKQRTMTNKYRSCSPI
jgi:transposase